jgi:hypothetical protein
MYAMGLREAGERSHIHSTTSQSFPTSALIFGTSASPQGCSPYSAQRFSTLYDLYTSNPQLSGCTFHPWNTVLRLASPFTHPCVRLATASQAREPDSPLGFSSDVFESVVTSL